MSGRWKPLEERFWEKVEKTPGCWLWRGKLDKEGYGEIRAEKLTLKAHRVSWGIHHPGRIEMKVLHKCDNRSCVRPDHLFLGTQAENVKDMEQKGRARKACGERVSTAILNEHDVLEIKILSARGITQEKIAESYGVKRAAISKIITGRTWKHKAQGVLL